MTNVILPTGNELVLDLLANNDGSRVLGRTSLATTDLALARDETWREGVRSGALEPLDLDQFMLQVVPGMPGNRGLKGYTVRLTRGKDTYEQTFSPVSLAPLARRTAARLLEQGAFKEGDQYLYCLNEAVPAAPADEQPSNSPAARITKLSDPLVIPKAPLANFMDRSEVMQRRTTPLEEGSPSPMPIFINDELWRQGLELSRRGGKLESAALWTGRLIQDTASPELFIVVDACIEAEHADEQELSVTFSGETWANIRRVLNQRRHRLNSPYERIVSAVHGHNFLPTANEDGLRTCEACAAARYCGRTTAQISIADFDWFAAVFSKQPWAFSVVHGFTARGEDDWRLYHLSDASLAPRTIRRLKE
jgi:hypothetical protein